MTSGGRAALAWTQRWTLANDRDVRLTIIVIIRAYLQPDAAAPWHGYDFEIAKRAVVSITVGHDAWVHGMPDGSEQSVANVDSDWLRSVFRLVTALELLLIVLVTGLMLVAIVLPGFVASSWLALGLTCFVIASVINLRSLGGRSKRLKRASVRTRSHFPQLPRRRLFAVSVLVLIGSLTMIMLTGEKVLAARYLGSHPAQAALISANKGPDCSRCLRQVVATYDVGGVTVTTALAGAAGSYDMTEDQAGEALVYDPQHPRRAMRARDWAAGRGTDATVTFWGLGLLGSVLVVAIPIMIRRRRQFGTLKPGTLIRAARCTWSHMSKGHNAYMFPGWCIEFADNTEAGYRDTSEFRIVLRARIGDAGIAGLDLVSQIALKKASHHRF